MFLKSKDKLARQHILEISKNTIFFFQKHEKLLNDS